MQILEYHHRVIEPLIGRTVKAFPVLGLTGPRQSGKSTVLQYVLPEYEYVTFDDPMNVSLFEDDPKNGLNIMGIRLKYTI